MKYYPQARTAIELGGQDAKVIFFRQNTATGRLEVSDMRMNGSCAGGTGAFIDEIASLLKVAPEEYEALAENGTQLYDISGRCGVYAKRYPALLTRESEGIACPPACDLQAFGRPRGPPWSLHHLRGPLTSIRHWYRLSAQAGQG